MKLSELLEQYATLKTYIEDEHAKLKPAEQALENLKAAVLARMNEEGITTTKSQAGHRLTIVNNTTARIVDKEAFAAFVLDTGNLSFLQNRVVTQAALDFLSEHDEPPPGVGISSINTLRFDRSK